MPFMDIDIESLSNDQLDEIASRIESYYMTDTGLKLRYAFDWEYNIRMREGDQHYDFSYGFERSTGKVQTSAFRRMATEIPRPVTNFLRSGSRTLVSNLARTRPKAIVRPNSTHIKDKWSAKISELILDDMHETLNEEEKRLVLANWLFANGTCFYKVFADASKQAINKIPVTEMVKQRLKNEVEFCPQCEFSRAAPLEAETEAVCPECLSELRKEMRDNLDEQGQPQFTLKSKQKLDEHGHALFRNELIYDVNDEIVTAFNLSVDPAAEHLRDARWVIEYSIKSLTWIKENFNKRGEGFTGKAGEVISEQSLNPVLTIKERLKTVLSSRGYYSSGSGYYMDLKNVAILKEYYERPSKKYPQGRQIVMAGRVILYVGPSFYFDADSGDWNPYTMFKYEILPGRFWGSTPMDDGVKIQRRINAIDSTMILIRQTTASPQWLNPFGSRVPNGTFSGRPNLIINYSPVGGNGARPERLPADSWPPQLMSEREMCVRDLRDLLGTVSVMEGIRPTGVNAASALNLLLEQANSAHAQTILGWEKGWEQVERKKLTLFKKLYSKPRQDIVNRLRALNKDIPDSMIVDFIGEDLRDNTNVRIEPYSTAPKLHAAKVSMLTDQLRYGAIDLSNPVSRAKYLEMVGLENFDQTTSSDVERSEWENSIIESDAEEILETLRYDNHDIHIRVHTDRMKRPDYWKLPSEVRNRYVEHVTRHEDWQLELSKEMAQKQAEVQAAGQQALVAEGVPSDQEVETGEEEGAATTEQVPVEAPAA